MYNYDFDDDEEEGVDTFLKSREEQARAKQVSQPLSVEESGKQLIADIKIKNSHIVAKDENFDDNFEATPWHAPSVDRSTEFRRHQLYRAGTSEVLFASLATVFDVNIGISMYFQTLYSMIVALIFMTLLVLPLLSIAYFGQGIELQKQDILMLYSLTLGNVGYDKNSPTFEADSQCTMPMLPSVNDTCVNVIMHQIPTNYISIAFTFFELLQILVFFIAVCHVSKKFRRIVKDKAKNLSPFISDYSVMVSNVPRGTTEAELVQHFSKLYQLEKVDFRGRLPVEDAVPVDRVDNTGEDFHLGSWVAECTFHKRIGGLLHRFERLQRLLVRFYRCRAKMKMHGDKTSHSRGRQPQLYKKYEAKMVLCAAAIDAFVEKFKRKYKPAAVGEAQEEEKKETEGEETKEAGGPKPPQPPSLAGMSAAVQELAAFEREGNRPKKPKPKTDYKVLGGIALKTRAAFVCFDYTESYARCMEDARRYGSLPYLFCYPKEMLFKGRRLSIRQAPKPEQINWENLDTSFVYRALLQLRTIGAAVLLLLAGLWVLIQAGLIVKQFQQSYPPSHVCEVTIPSLYLDYDSYSPDVVASLQITRATSGNLAAFDKQCDEVVPGSFYGVLAVDGLSFKQVGTYSYDACSSNSSAGGSLCPAFNASVYCPCFSLTSTATCYASSCMWNSSYFPVVDYSPTMRPTFANTTAPTVVPSRPPSLHPTIPPTNAPTFTRSPTILPTRAPTTLRPSAMPTFSGQTNEPTVSFRPTSCPSSVPTSRPTSRPSSRPTSRPSRPTVVPTAATPSVSPTTAEPTTAHPSSMPSSKPSAKPSTSRPSSHPSSVPSARPASRPTAVPTSRPSARPSSRPSSRPSPRPSSRPSSRPSARPTSRPTVQPTQYYYANMTDSPSPEPTSTPSTSMPSTAAPTTRSPTSTISALPTTDQPSSGPSAAPTAAPITSSPTPVPTIRTPRPTRQPTVLPTEMPATAQPSSTPTFLTQEPSVYPSEFPTEQPSWRPSAPPAVGESCLSSFAASDIGSCYCRQEIDEKLSVPLGIVSLLQTVTSFSFSLSTESPELCGTYNTTFLFANIAVYISILVTVIVNYLLKATIRYLTAREVYVIKDHQQVSLFLKLLTATYLNMACVILVAFGTTSGVPALLADYQVFQGPFATTSRDWYGSVGFYLVVVFLITSCTPLLVRNWDYFVYQKLKNYFLYKAVRHKESYLALQHDLNAWEANEEFDVPAQAAQWMAMLFLAMTFAPGIPLLMPFCLLFLLLHFRADKFFFLRYFIYPKYVSLQVASAVISALPFAAVLRLCMAIWMFSSGDILSPSFGNMAGASADGTQGYASTDMFSLAAYMSFVSSLHLQLETAVPPYVRFLEQHAIRGNTFPLLAVLALVVVSMILRRLWRYLPFYLVQLGVQALYEHSQRKKRYAHSKIAGIIHPYDLFKTGDPLRRQSAPYTGDYFKFFKRKTTKPNACNMLCGFSRDLEASLEDFYDENWDLAQGGNMEYDILSKVWPANVKTASGQMKMKGDGKKTFEVVAEQSCNTYNIEKLPGYKDLFLSWKETSAESLRVDYYKHYPSRRPPEKVKPVKEAKKAPVKQSKVAVAPQGLDDDEENQVLAASVASPRPKNKPSLLKAGSSLFRSLSTKSIDLSAGAANEEADNTEETPKPPPRVPFKKENSVKKLKRRDSSSSSSGSGSESGSSSGSDDSSSSGDSGSSSGSESGSSDSDEDE